MNQIETRTSSLTPDHDKVQIADLRLLATTDLHMEVLGFDYVADKPFNRNGLAGLASLIETARTEARAQGRGCLLVDNGDMLQGNPLADWLAQQPVNLKHPVPALLNALQYDVVGLGNHDLDHGPQYPAAIASYMKMPLVCTNMASTVLRPIQKTALITCTLPAQSDSTQAPTISVGFVSIIPPQTAVWNKHVLQDTVLIQSSQTVLQASIADLRHRGADLIVALAHIGIETAAPDDDPDNGALSIAQMTGIDVVVAGHTHRRFPGSDHASTDEVDNAAGTLARRPAAMPGYAGSDLAVIDLKLAKSDTGTWRVLDHVSTLRENAPDTPPSALIQHLAAPAHRAVRSELAETIGETATDLHNFFALAAPTATDALCAQAIAETAARDLAETPYADLPLVTATAPHTAGGRAGPAHYLHIPKGSIRKRHIAGLNPYSNRVWSILQTGAELRARVEHAARIYAQTSLENTDQPLLDNRFPSYSFDTFFGLSYEIDPSQPAGQGRIRALKYKDRALKDTDLFILATNQFRAAGGGGYTPCSEDQIVLRSAASLSTALTDIVGGRIPMRRPDDSHPWRLRTTDQAMQATFDTSPNAAPFIRQISHLYPEIRTEQTPRGFLRLRLTF